MTNKFISLVDGNRSGIAPNLSTRLTRPDCVSFASRWRVLPILLLCLTLFLGVGNVWATDPVASATPTTGKSYVVAVYSGSKYIALPNIGTSSSTWSGEEVTVNANGKVSSANPPLWEFTVNPSNSNQFYLKYKSGNSTYTLYRNGTGNNHNISAQTSSSNYWTFTAGTSTDAGKYSVKAERGSTHTILQYTSSKWQVSGTSASYSIILLEVASSCSVKPTVGANLTNVSATANSITATVPISAVGGCDITENGLVYSSSVSTPTVGAANCTKVTTTACGGTAANKTVTITGLTCGTTYYVRGYAINDAGTQYTTNTKTQATSDCLVDYFIDEVQSSTGYTGEGMQKTGDYSNNKPTIEDKDVATSGNCQVLHYHFCGWVTEANKANPNGHLATINGTATGTTYYAVWAKQGAGSGSFDGTHEGNFYIYADISNTKYYAKAFAQKIDNTTNITEASLFTFEKIVQNDSTFFAIKSGNYYLGYSSSTNFTTTNETPYKWYPTSGSHGTWRLKAYSTLNSSTVRSIVYRTGTTNKFAPYAVSGINGTEYYDVEIGGSTSYTDSIAICCTPLGSINGSFF